MRDSLLRVIDDLETKENQTDEKLRERREIGDTVNEYFYSGYSEGLYYAIDELRKVLKDHGQS